LHRLYQFQQLAQPVDRGYARKEIGVAYEVDPRTRSHVAVEAC